MFAYTFWGSATFAFLAIGASYVAAAIEHIYAAHYNREIYLATKEKRKLAEEKRELAEAGRRLAESSQELLAQMKNPEWEPVEDEADDNPPSDEEEGGA